MKYLLLLLLCVIGITAASCDENSTADAGNSSDPVTAKNSIAGSWDIHYSGKSSYDKATSISLSGSSIVFDGSSYSANFSGNNVYFGKALNGTYYSYDIYMQGKNSFTGQCELEIQNSTTTLRMTGSRR